MHADQAPSSPTRDRIRTTVHATSHHQRYCALSGSAGRNTAARVKPCQTQTVLTAFPSEFACIGAPLPILINAGPALAFELADTWRGGAPPWIGTRSMRLKREEVDVENRVLWRRRHVAAQPSSGLLLLHNPS